MAAAAAILDRPMPTSRPSNRSLAQAMSFKLFLWSYANEPPGQLPSSTTRVVSQIGQRVESMSFGKAQNSIRSRSQSH
jgi:hypothetical protein